MKISIDTKEDSPEEIRKAIMMLNSLLHEKETYSNSGNIFESSSSSSRDIFGNAQQPSSSDNSGNIFGNMFGESSTPQPSSAQEPEPEKQDIPEIIPYH